MSSYSEKERPAHGAPDHGGAALRGATGAAIGRTFWLIAGALSLLVFASFIIVSFLSAANDNARIDRMQTRGIPVIVTVTNCIGDIGGSGSNVSGYTCHGDYSLGSSTYHEIIGAMSALAASGAKVRGIVDPSQHGTVELASAVKRSSASSNRYIAPSLLSVVLVALALALLRIARRSDPSRHAHSEIARTDVI
jgi:hypothetical protein